MIIYKVTNIINNKIYIGQTINSLQKRQSKHFSEAARFINKPAGTSAISKVCKGELKNVYGYKWKYK